jgi:glucose-1-phosphate adenylyltransferase
MGMDQMLAVVLGGGRGTRLWPLTKLRAKPAVPIGGKYRLVDIPVSNCLNSGIQRIAILTQFNSVSLHRHIAQTYHFDLFHPGWVQILAAEQTMTSLDWYQGTADAVRKQMLEIRVTGAEDVLVLAGDHLYRMDYAQLAAFHWDHKADITLAAKPVAESETGRLGLVKLDSDGRVTGFIEKPKSAEQRRPYAVETNGETSYLGSMGLYLFKAEVLEDLLRGIHDDFGSGVIPAAIDTHRVFAFPFDGYWEDVGTIRAYYEANLALTDPDPNFSFQVRGRPIFTHPRFLPGSRTYDVKLDRALLSEGCIIDGATISHSVIGIRSVIGRGVDIRDSVIMGADYYEAEARPAPFERPPLGIGPETVIRGAIVDKNARIGAKVCIEPFPEGESFDAEQYSVQDGIVVVPKHAIIQDGARITPDSRAQA